MRSVRRLLSLSLLTTGAVVACSSDSTTNGFAPLALSLSLSPNVDTVFVADTIGAGTARTLSLSAQSLGHAVQTPTGVEWSSSDESVAVVSASGIVTIV